jgi:hypothetical protein
LSCICGLSFFLFFAYLDPGFDEEGFKTAVVTEQPAVYHLHADSGLAKVWAGDNSHITEKDEVYPGMSAYAVAKQHCSIAANYDRPTEPEFSCREKRQEVPPAFDFIKLIVMVNIP